MGYLSSRLLLFTPFQGDLALLDPLRAQDFVTNYILGYVSFLLLVGYKPWKTTQWVKLGEMDYLDWEKGLQ